MVAGDAGLTALFDAGVPGLMDRIASDGDAGQAFLAEFETFVEQFGARGPNEWEVRNHTWETKPELALAAIDRMRLADDDAAPELRNAHMASERERIVAEIESMLAADPET
ncbi:MAG TPA: hypothetical protein QGI71_06125 [Dehalococcoidia bacterium]|nr:hypothetical protein [Dehalococcoidia bacterium]